MLKKVVLFTLFLCLVFVVQWFGNYAQMSSIADWYEGLRKPAWTAPNWVFGLIWILIYVLIAWVGYRLWIAPKSHNRALALIFWTLHLLTNAIWAYLFFGQQNIFAGALDLSAMIAFALITLFYTLKVSVKVGLCFGIYILWLFYAGMLNWAILFFNP